jgi:amino acid adenylation domain-containing protein
MPRIKTEYPEICKCGSARRALLSFQQERVLYLDKLSAGGPLWNRITCKRLWGAVEIEPLRKSVDRLVERHPVLRTRIGLDNGQPFQCLHDRLETGFESIDLSAMAGDAALREAKHILKQQYAAPMTLEGGDLFKAAAIRVSENEFWVLLKLHHIISDETTLQILWDDLKSLYNSHFGGVESAAVEDISYIDYATWLREQFGGCAASAQEAWWLNQFGGNLPRLELPVDAPEPAQLTFGGALEKRHLPQSLIQRLQTFSFERRVIPFSTMLAAYYLLLHNYCGQDDLIVGSVFSGRHYSPKIKHLAGFFTNTVALRTRIQRDQAVNEFVKEVHRQVTAAHDHQDYPFEQLVDRVSPQRPGQRNPLFRALFNMVTSHPESRTFAGVAREEWIEPEITATQVDFFLDFRMGPDDSELRIEYNTSILRRATVQRMLGHYITLLENILQGADTPVGEVRMCDDAEETFILSAGEGPCEPAALERDIVEILEERAARTPEQTALVWSGGEMTCGEFNRRANQLAAALTEAGVHEGDIVAILLDRSPEMVVSTIAVLKAGAAYLPIEPAAPPQRIEYMLRDSGARCALVQGGAATPLRAIRVDHPDSYIGDGQNPVRKVPATAPAYLIYTSGSTGAPKGVLVERRSLSNTLHFLNSRYALPDKTILLKTNFTFDVCATELFGWIFDDGRLAVLDRAAERDPRQLLDAIERFKVTHVNFVPSMLDVFLSGLHKEGVSTLERLAFVFVAGEALKPDLVQHFYSAIRGVRLENLYGPTEAAIYATWYSLPRGEDLKRVPIGAPIANTRAYILDEFSRLAPVGVTGELCLGGAGLARGYLKRPELTQQKFCADPFRGGERIYRTGDLARWSDDGTIQYLGRIDGQVKVRGFRIELGEVEQKLLACPAVSEAVVTAAEDQFGQRRLIAYVATRNGNGNGNAAQKEIRSDLREWLPCYMIPDVFVMMDRLPRLPSGKFDLRALPQPQQTDAAPQNEETRPVTELESTIIQVAEQLLNTTGLTPESNFFHLGGNSLLTLRFVAALDSTLGTSISVIDFLALPTIADIAKIIGSSLPASEAMANNMAATQLV